MAGCEYVIHTASPFPLTEPVDANEVIEPAKEGTLNVMRACVEANCVKRVVITSSAVAITAGHAGNDQNELYTNVAKWITSCRILVI